jgi:hypothetical protein
MANYYMRNRDFSSQILKAAARDSEKFQPQHTQELNTELMEKWHRFGLLKGLTDNRSRGIMSQLLENQAQWILNEADTADAEGYNTVLFPMVRRVFGGLLANDIVSVQPMSLPSGLVFYVDFTDEQGNRVHDQLFYNQGQGIGTKYWLGNTGNLENAGSASSAVLDLGGSVDTSNLLGDTYVYYTGDLENKTSATIQDSYAVNHDGFSLNPKTHLHKYSLPKVYVKPSNENAVYPDDAVQLYVVTGDNASSAGVEASNQVKLVLDPVTSQLGLIFYEETIFSGVNTNLFTLGGYEVSNQPYDDADNISGSATFNWARPDYIVDFGFNPFEVGDNINQPTNAYTLQGEEVSNIREINLEVKSSPIVAETRKLKTKWTPELQQDLQAYHSIDAEQELTAMMSDEVAMEIDREIINDVITSAGTVIDMDLSGVVDGGETAHDKYRTAVEGIMAGSNAIHKKTLRGHGNWVIVSPEFATVLQFAGAFLRNDTDKTITFSGGMQLAGLLENRVKVYVDPYMTPTTAIMGYTGNSFLESGYVYAPYVPVQLTPTVYDPETFVPRKGLLTRYGKKLIRSDFFVRFNITGWPTSGLGSAIYEGGFGQGNRAFDIGRTEAWTPTRIG